MDFTLTEEQTDLQGLVRQILQDQVTPERLREIEATEENFDATLWASFADTGLIGIGLPEAHGGGGYGYLESCIVVEQIGMNVAPIPYFETVVLGATPLARFGTDQQKRDLLPRVVSGELIMSAALTEVGRSNPGTPARAARTGDGWTLTGTVDCIPAGMLASRILVPATTPDGGVIVAIVDPTAPGVARHRQRTTNKHSQARLTFTGAAIGDHDVVGTPQSGQQILDWMLERAIGGLCAMQIGLCEQALRLTASYTSTREQFGRPIATFQAVAQRAANAYIDTEGVRLTGWQAIWMLANELPATKEVAIAKFWAAEGAQRVAHAAQHLHGGMGVDCDYPLHRFFLWVKLVELSLGSATPSLQRLGRMLADEPVPVPSSAA